MAAVNIITTGGLGNGTLDTTVSLLLLRGLTPAVQPATEVHCVTAVQGFASGLTVGEGYASGLTTGEGCS